MEVFISMMCASPVLLISLPNLTQKIPKKVRKWVLVSQSTKAAYGIEFKYFPQRIPHHLET